MSKKQIQMTPELAVAQSNVTAARRNHNSVVKELLLFVTTSAEVSDLRTMTLKGMHQRAQHTAKELAEANLALFTAELNSIMAPKKEEIA